MIWARYSFEMIWFFQGDKLEVESSLAAVQAADHKRREETRQLLNSYKEQQERIKKEQEKDAQIRIQSARL